MYVDSCELDVFGPFQAKVNDLKSFYKHIGPHCRFGKLCNEFTSLIDECDYPTGTQTRTDNVTH